VPWLQQLLIYSINKQGTGASRPLNDYLETRRRVLGILAVNMAWIEILVIILPGHAFSLWQRLSPPLLTTSTMTLVMSLGQTMLDIFLVSVLILK
jgi:hypothetical protein